MNQQRQLRAQIEEALANLDVQVATVYHSSRDQLLCLYFSGSGFAIQPKQL